VKCKGIFLKNVNLNNPLLLSANADHRSVDVKISLMPVLCIHKFGNENQPFFCFRLFSLSTCVPTPTRGRSGSNGLSFKSFQFKFLLHFLLAHTFTHPMKPNIIFCFPSSLFLSVSLSLSLSVSLSLCLSHSLPLSLSLILSIYHPSCSDAVAMQIPFQSVFFISLYFGLTTYSNSFFFDFLPF
jgi:hypothetical protein